MIKRIHIHTKGQGLYEVTPQVKEMFKQTSQKEGLCTLFVRHTSCSLIVQENADLSAKNDMEKWLNRLVPENDPLYTHTYEGADDMPAHLKSLLTSVQVSIPFERGSLLLGNWQGVYLWEHRHVPHKREIILHTN